MAKRDYYQVLGVGKGATQDEIRKAYRKLARELHPDVNKAADASAKFAEVQEAYDTLSEPTKRKQYDQFGHTPPRGSGDPGGVHYQWNAGPGGRQDMDAEDLSSMFDAFFGGRGGGFAGAGKKSRRSGRAAPPAADVSEHPLDITFMTAVRGGTEPLRLSVNGSTRTLDVTIPKGIATGAKLRVRGGAEIGDVILTVRVGAHPIFRRSELAHGAAPEGLDLYLDLPLTIAEATLGATVPTPTLDGSVELTVPPGTASGRKLRLRGRGIEDAQGRKGDLYAIVKVVPPDGTALSESEREVLQRISERGVSPREGQGWPRSA